MLNLLAKLGSLAIGISAGFGVYSNLSEITGGWIPPVSGAIVAIIVYAALYYPLARHVADMLNDKMATALHRGRHIRSGTGIDAVPETPAAPKCSICGAPDGPICANCEEEMNRTSRT
jgi:hypothetical protein